MNFLAKKTNIISGILLILFSLVRCDSEDHSNIPNVGFKLAVSPAELATIGPGIMKTFEGGVNGIIVYHNPLEGYTAYDRTCTYEPAFNCAVLVNDTITFPECPCCGSQFILELGAIPADGSEAKYQLKEYRTYWDGDFLIVSN